MELLKNILFISEIIVGAFMIIFLLIYFCFEIINKLLKIRKTAIMYLQAKKDGFDSWKPENNIYIGLDDKIKCCGGNKIGIEKSIEILEKALNQEKSMLETKNKIDIKK